MIEALDNDEDQENIDTSDVVRYYAPEPMNSTSLNLFSKLKSFITQQTLSNIFYIVLRVPLIIMFDYLLSDTFANRIETYLDNPIKIPNENQQSYLYMFIAFLQNVPLKTLVKLNIYLSIPVMGLILLICLILSSNRTLTMIYSYVLSLLSIFLSFYFHTRVEGNIIITFVEIFILTFYLQMIRLRPPTYINFIQKCFCFFTAVIFMSYRFPTSSNSFSWIDSYYFLWLMVHLSEVFIFRTQSILRTVKVECVDQFLLLYTIGGLQRLLNFLQENIPVAQLLKIFWFTKICISPLGIRYFCTSSSFNEIINKFKFIPLESNQTISEVITVNQTWPTSVYFTTIFHGTETVLCLISLACIIASIMDVVSTRVFRLLDLWSDIVDQIGTLTGVIFFLLVFQSNLMILDLNLRHIPLLKAFGLLPVAVCSFLHSVLEPILLKMAMQTMLTSVVLNELEQNFVENKENGSKLNLVFKIIASFHQRRVYNCLEMIVALIFYMLCLWRLTKFSTWIITVSGFILELVVRLLGSLVQYGLHVLDGHNLLKDSDTFDEYIFRTKMVTSCCEFLLGVGLLCNGFYVLVFEAPNVVRAVILVAHTNLNIIKKSRRGWQLLNNRRSAFDKVNHLSTPSEEQIQQYDTVCSICLNSMTAETTCITPCTHLFHRKCLQKAFYANQNCPLCSQVISSANSDHILHDHQD